MRRSALLSAALCFLALLLAACARGVPPPDLSGPPLSGEGVRLAGGSAPATASDPARPCTLSVQGGMGSGSAVTVSPGAQVTVEVRCVEPALVQVLPAIPGAGVVMAATDDGYVVPVLPFQPADEGRVWLWEWQVAADMPMGTVLLLHAFADGIYSGTVELAVQGE